MFRWTVRVLLLLTFPLWGLALICWKIFVRLVNFIGIQEVRNYKGALQTPIHFYEHPETKQTVLLIGMTHVADEAYFEKVRRVANFLEEKAGHKVLYEFVRVLPEELKNFGPAEMKFYEQLVAYRNLHRRAADIMSLRYQFDTKLAFYASPSWTCNDASATAIFQKFLEEGIDFIPRSEKYEKFLEKIGKPASRWLLNEAIAETAAAFLAAKAVCLISPADKKRFRLILDWRNEIAARGIFEEISKGNNVVAIWGAAHLPGIGKLLQEKDFVKTFEEWTTAYTKRKYSLLKAILSL